MPARAQRPGGGVKGLPTARLRARLAAMRGRRVLVVGDVMLDEFVWGRVARISPEAPVPVVEVTGQSFHVGGAANVAANVCALGGGAVIAGVVGEDAAAERLRDLLAGSGIEMALAVATDGRPTTLKTRILAHHQQVVRADRERSDDVDPPLAAALEAGIRSRVASAHAVVVSDYQKGVVTARLMRTLREAARRRRIPLLVDPKVRHLGLYRGATLVTPNQQEAEHATGVRIRSGEDLHEAGRRILASVGCTAALVTRGEHGMSLFERRRAPLHIPTTAREVFDVTGAGDTVIATLALALAAGAPLSEAAFLANLAAGVVVGKLGTATASPEDLLRAADAA